MRPRNIKSKELQVKAIILFGIIFVTMFFLLNPADPFSNLPQKDSQFIDAIL